jgi:cytochrome c
MRLSGICAGWLAAGLALGFAPPAGADTAVGERLFRSQCSGCHSVEPGQNRAGPSLHNLFARRSGTLEDFDYSDALRDAGIDWSPETLDAFLADPRAMVPGSKMVLWGLPPEQRREIIAYLQTLEE